VLILVVARSVPVVKPVEIFNIPDDILVNTLFVIVLLAAKTDPVVSDVLIIAVPTTSKLALGAVLPIPTLPVHQ